jgi:ATP-dependent helicase/nuclease subunit B
MEALDRAYPYARKRLAGPDVNYGRELLVAHARRGGGWVGWEAATVRTIADALAFVPLAERGVRTASDIEIATLVNRALDHVVGGSRDASGFATLARGLGFRSALRDTLLELRTAGVSAAEVRGAAHAGSPARELPAVLEAYERLLAEEKLADPAFVLRAALDAFDGEAPFVLDGVVALAPGLTLHGLAGELVERLRSRSSTVVLDADIPAGAAVPSRVLRPSGAVQAGCSPLAWAQATALPAPDETTLDPTLAQVDLFAAATPSEELRELCRRVAAEGIRWDDVEIVATDPDGYGIALDALTQHLDVGATMLAGVPLARTRLGRAIERWLFWLEDGLPADVLRQALEAGELRAPRPHDVVPTALARDLRALRVGWGRARYEAAIEQLTSGKRVESTQRREDESDEEFAERKQSRQRVSAALAALLRTLLDAAPTTPERASDRPVQASCAELARATLSYLGLVAVHGEAEAQTMSRIRERLGDLAEVGEPRGPFAGALAALRESLAEVRAWPLVTSERKPWSASGGMPHLTDLVHAGTTGRRRVFVVGLDAERTGGASRQDPLLPDALRRAIDAGAPGRLVTSIERRDRAAWVLGSALASLRGHVTLSYATSGTLDGREAGPSPVLLQAWRVQRGDAALSYEDLREHLRPPVSAVPARSEGGALAGVELLDARDVWLDALADGPLLLDGSAAVREAFPMLASGLAAHDLANEDEATAYHGLVPDAGPVLDPTANPERQISPSSLEKLGACPLAWFYRYGLSLFPPGDPEYDAERWLDQLQRGSLLHKVFETFGREYAGRQQEIATETARSRILVIADAEVARWRGDVPPPGEAVFEVERGEIRRAALAFLAMERAQLSGGITGDWVEFELSFGRDRAPGEYVLPDGGTLRVNGQADRVDRLPNGSFRVVDYKTGKSKRYTKDGKAGPFNGGRQLQPALYAAAVETMLGGGAQVSHFEYRFPTERGGNEVVAYDAAELEAARGLVRDLLAQLREGHFIPTTDAADCSYCDYQAICRASRGDWDTHSPRAEWARAHAEELPLYRLMLARRAQPGPDA